LLLLQAVRRERTFLRAHPEHELNDVQQVHLARYIRDRVAGIPTQYITGRQEFWGLDVLVNPSVLIPRPETEHLVERTLAVSARNRALRILDCGTGSGCIALALAKELSQARLTASDLSIDAVVTAKANAERLGLAESISFVQADLLSCFPSSSFDLVVSNPPYVSLADAPTLAREVRDHEPATALFAGPDGASVYRRLIPDAGRVLRPGGWLILELGYNLALQVRGLLSTPPWDSIATDRDLAGIERVIFARRTT
jgi:release factor glutamine methyltransferase